MFEYTGDGCLVPKDITSVRFNEGLRKIGHHAFRDCTSLESITLPQIGNNSFSGCYNLREVIFYGGLQKIARGMFYHCTSLKSITLPSTLVEIDGGAFNGCSNLKKVILNEGLLKIREVAFQQCSSVESITIPSTLIEIGMAAFNGCSNLREVIFNDGLQKIGESAFSYCTSLETIKLPSTVVEIRMCAFADCRNLREVKLNGIPQYFDSRAFRYCDALERFLFTTISYRLVNIIQTSRWEELEDKLNEVRGVVHWESEELFVSTLTHHNWDDIRRDLGRITRLVSHYELKEATTTFELALWKSKLDQADAINTTNRSAYRIEVPGPVKDTMLQYMDHT